MITLIRIKKNNFIKVYRFHKDKSMTINFYRSATWKPDFELNPDHIYFSNGYRTVITSDTVIESINPLDLESSYPVEKFRDAIESKAISDVFNHLRSNQLDLTKLLLIGNLLASVIILYFLFMRK